MPNFTADNSQSPSCEGEIAYENNPVADLHPFPWVDAPLTSIGPLRHRGTECLSHEDVCRLRAAYHFARHIGLPLNIKVDLHWGLTGDGHEGVARRIVRLKDVASKFCARRGFPFTALWVREAPDDIEHMHLLMHLPRQHRQAFTEMFDVAWVEAIDGGTRWTDVYSDGVMSYLNKGIARSDDASRKAFGIKPKAEGRGYVPGKRCGVTQNIGPAAQRAYLTPLTGDCIPNTLARAYAGFWMSVTMETAA